MIHQVLNLKSCFPHAPIGENATLTVYSRDISKEIDINRRFPAVLICPGGAYAFVSEREAEPVALRYLEAGFTALVLNYTVAPHAAYPTQLLEVSAAMALARRNADVWHINKDKIAVTGFSAGGHLACHLGTDWHQPFITETLCLSKAENKPNAMILCYPVISSGEFAHHDSIKFLRGGQDIDIESFSLEKRVTKDTPPAFIWHTADDSVVPIENSLMMASALQAAKISFELHIYRSGPHGLSVCNKESSNDAQPTYKAPRISGWFELAVGWLAELGFTI